MMASGKSAKKSRSKAPVISRKQGPPWLTIGAVVAILALAGAIFFVVFNKQSENRATEEAMRPWTPTAENRDPSANIKDIHIGEFTESADGGPVTFKLYGAGQHVTELQRVAYDIFPPIGGPHDGFWANCQGVVYNTAVRDENMVHTLEHGAVWIAYNPDTIADGDLAILSKHVEGVPFTTLSPYPGLDRPISLQAWGHQLKLDSASDERVLQFITSLRKNQWVYPETGATCQQPTFNTVNPPAFDASPRGADAVPMSGEGSTAAEDEISGVVSSAPQSSGAGSNAPQSSGAGPSAPQSSGAGSSAPQSSAGSSAAPTSAPKASS